MRGPEANIDCGYRIRPREVVHETIDDEVIVIQLARGNYFSLRGSAAAIWALLGAGLGRRGVAAALAGACGIELDRAAAAVDPLLTMMIDEDLIEETGEPGTDSHPPIALSGAFEPPMLEKYTDMQDFLMIDPVHEVSEVGWPSPAD